MIARQAREAAEEANRWNAFLRSHIDYLLRMDPVYHDISQIDKSVLISGEFFWVTDPTLAFIDGDPQKPTIGFCITFEDESVTVYEDLPPELSMRMYRSIVSGWRKHMDKFKTSEEARRRHAMQKASSSRRSPGVS